MGNDPYTSEKKTNRRKFVKIAGAAGIGSLAGCMGDTDDGFPEDDIQMTIPMGPGGGYDYYSRLFAQYLPEYLDVDVVAENVDAAGGLVATEDVYTDESGGHNMMFLGLQGWVIDDIEEDWFDLLEFTYLPQVRRASRGMVIRDDLEFDSWDEFGEAVRNDEIVFGTADLNDHGTTNPAMMGEVTGAFSAQDVIDNSVVYDSGSATVPALDAGEVDVVGSLAISSIMDNIDLENVEFFMTLTTGEESPDAVPEGTDTLDTMGIEESELIEDASTDFYPFVVAPDVPEENADILREAITEAAEDEDLLADSEESDRPIAFATAEEARVRAENKVEVWGDLYDDIFQ